MVGLKHGWAGFLRGLYRLLDRFWFRVLLLPALLLAAGMWLAEWLDAEGWFNLFDRTSAVLGLSAIFAWPMAIYLWARRAEARLAFEVQPGVEVSRFREQFKASLILVSRQEQPEWHLRHLRPEHAELVWTPQSDVHARSLIDAFQDQVNIRERDSQRCLNDAFDIQAVHDHCHRLLRTLVAEHGREHVCVDVTGGTAVMSLGAFQVAEELGASTVYLRGRGRDRHGNPIIDRPASPDNAEVVLLSNRSGRGFA